MEKAMLTPEEQANIDKLKERFGDLLTTMGGIKTLYPRKTTIDDLIKLLPDTIPLPIDVFMAGEILWKGETEDMVYLMILDKDALFWDRITKIFDIPHSMVLAGRFRFGHYGDDLPVLKIYDKGIKCVKPL